MHNFGREQRAAFLRQNLSHGLVLGFVDISLGIESAGIDEQRHESFPITLRYSSSLSHGW